MVGASVFVYVATAVIVHVPLKLALTGLVRLDRSLGQSKNGLPSIGPIPHYPRCYAVLGYGGNGITYSMLAAQLVAAAIGGRRDPGAALFGFRSSSR